MKKGRDNRVLRITSNISLILIILVVAALSIFFYFIQKQDTDIDFTQEDRIEKLQEEIDGEG